MSSATTARAPREELAQLLAATALPASPLVSSNKTVSPSAPSVASRLPVDSREPMARVAALAARLVVATLEASSMVAS